ncbi:hypothetical protein L1987_65759 [Smallanthus sonchifolius]|uniref:Uncharacterized protein n=1 Tax=Smallanthus sonchifolius TaxID=185202 RepID=A0ACB9BVK5_9ASTR|nr:hypothetical protein L1987_65759 [Smallanthus sonchifolius]
MVDEEPKRSSPKQSENGANGNCVFSPGFRSAAAMAGWDEETLLMASLVVEDTPDRDSKQKRRSDPMFKTPPTNSRRKRRDQRKSPVSNFVAVLDLGEEEEGSKEAILEEKKEQKIDVDVNGKKVEKSNETGSGNASIPCIDRLREELSCAICLEICFEPSTTSCGHSFCKKCLRSAADKCGKRCPKCRQLISNGRSCTINTVLWNTIQLLFPQEIEARKVSVGASSTLESSDLLSPPPRRRNQYRSVIQALNSPEGEQLSMERRRRTSNHHQHNLRQQSFRPASVVLLNSRESGDNSVSRRRRRREVAAPPPGQVDDATLALRLQREEFMRAFGGSEQPPQEQQHRRSSVATASGNLRAMASRAINLRNLRDR